MGFHGETTCLKLFVYLNFWNFLSVKQNHLLNFRFMKKEYQSSQMKQIW